MQAESEDLKPATHTDGGDMEEGFDSPGVSKENVEPEAPLTGRKRFSPGFSPLGRRSQRRNTGTAPSTAALVATPGGRRRPAQRSLMFGEPDAAQDKLESSTAVEPMAIEPAVQEEADCPEPSALQAHHQDSTAVEAEQRPQDSESHIHLAEATTAEQAPPDWLDLPEDGALVSPDIHGEPLAAQGAIDGRQVLAELEGIVIGSPEAVAKKVRRSRIDLLAEDTSKIAINNKAPSQPASLSGSPIRSPLRV